ncbi:hypothetical protein V8C86DRAFT_2531590 [Haematococcus lacustris]
MRRASGMLLIASTWLTASSCGQSQLLRLARHGMAAQTCNSTVGTLKSCRCLPRCLNISAKPPYVLARTTLLASPW